ncbi:hypothetical protein BDR26DRAFT_860180 [Obelidium mucronatum]|nr:hypothetical protein BDR26DRAFT_860180 [Obelidium mucronatum]
MRLGVSVVSYLRGMLLVYIVERVAAASSSSCASISASLQLDSQITSDTMTPQKCISHCIQQQRLLQKPQTAAMIAPGFLCQCSNHWIGTAAPETSCTQLCSDSTSLCGGALGFWSALAASATITMPPSPMKSDTLGTLAIAMESLHQEASPFSPAAVASTVFSLCLVAVITCICCTRKRRPKDRGSPTSTDLIPTDNASDADSAVVYESGNNRKRLSAISLETTLTIQVTIPTRQMTDRHDPVASSNATQATAVEKPSIFNLHDNKIESPFTRDLNPPTIPPPPPLPPGPMFENQLGHPVHPSHQQQQQFPVGRRSGSLKRNTTSNSSNVHSFNNNSSSLTGSNKKYTSAESKSLPGIATSSAGSGIFGRGSAKLHMPHSAGVSTSQGTPQRPGSKKSGGLYTEAPPVPAFDIAELQSALNRHLDASRRSADVDRSTIPSSVGKGAEYVSDDEECGSRGDEAGTRLEFTSGNGLVSSRTSSSLFMEALEINIANEAT